MTQVLPRTDGFTASGAGSWETVLGAGLYLQARLANADAAFGSGGSGYTMGNLGSWDLSPAHITDRWRTQTPIFPSTYASPQAITLCDQAASGNTAPGCHIFREYVDDDVAVLMSWQLLANSALIFNPAFAQTLHVGVVARARAGAIVGNGTAGAYLEQMDGYVFCLLHTVALGMRHEIWRINAGTVTRLWTDQTASVSPVAWGTGSKDFRPWVTRGMRLEVSGSSPVTIRASYLKPDEDTVDVTITDASGSRITAAGRCGFFASPELDLTIQRAVAVNYFQAGPVGGPVVLRDEWERTNLLACGTVQTVSGNLLFLPVGRKLASAFYGDVFGVTGFTSKLKQNSTNNRLVFDSSSVNATGYYTSQRPSTALYSHHRSAVVTFPTGGGATAINRWVSVCVRTAHATAGSNPTAGYRADLRYDDDAGVHSVYLRRLEPGSVITTLAFVTGVSLALDTPYEISIAIENEGPDPSNGIPTISVYLDGALVALTNPSPPSGISIDVTGVVRDNSSARIVSGTGETLYINLTAGAVKQIFVDTWDVGAGDIADELDGNDMANVVVARETDGATGTLTLPLFWPYDLRIIAPSIDIPFDSQHRYTGAASTRQRRVWTINAGPIDSGMVSYLRGFAEDHGYSAIPFTFSPPEGGAACIARFYGEGLRTRLVRGAVTEYDVLIVEMLP